MTLGAGEEAVVAKGIISKTDGETVSHAVVWQQRRLVFKDTPLGEVTAEFNRYNASQLRVEGDVLKAKPLTGVFSADHPQSLVLYLTEFAELEVRPEGKDWVVRDRTRE
jgi:transmembrane sensor